MLWAWNMLLLYILLVTCLAFHFPVKTFFCSTEVLVAHNVPISWGWKQQTGNAGWRRREGSENRIGCSAGFASNKFKCLMGLSKPTFTTHGLPMVLQLVVLPSHSLSGHLSAALISLFFKLPLLPHCSLNCLLDEHQFWATWYPKSKPEAGLNIEPAWIINVILYMSSTMIYPYVLDKR